ncbi:cupin domain-containing protein [Enhydrobacter sp.]|jgi:uncharacterized protein YjlB|uniref:cupin domain-containing protein n=1 Tax=Enhydrobacter sp. TaxID=1894999 RepID=UPI0026050F8A|nr:cupin domain-containing protein [Enhydrobacter sp.]WIM11501.1 MAG: Cupin domain-containing protein [Enhydrobacter sp.]
MPIVDETDRTLESLIRACQPETMLFPDDGRTPNNATLPLLLYRGAVVLPKNLDPAAVFEELFVANGWGRSWRNGVYSFLHFHTRTHEVLGIARGKARVRFGGDRGETVTVTAGDVVVLPAGTGHQRIGPAENLLVVGAYPPGGSYDQLEPDEADGAEARARIARVRVPATDPIYGSDGPLVSCWNGCGG